MNIFIWGEEKMKTFNIFDIAVFKLYLFSIGVIVGAYFSALAKEFIAALTVIAVVTGAWMVYKMFK